MKSFRYLLNRFFAALVIVGAACPAFAQLHVVCDSCSLTEMELKAELYAGQHNLSPGSYEITVLDPEDLLLRRFALDVPSGGGDFGIGNDPFGNAEALLLSASPTEQQFTVKMTKYVQTVQLSVTKAAQEAELILYNDQVYKSAAHALAYPQGAAGYIKDQLSQLSSLDALKLQAQTELADATYGLSATMLNVISSQVEVDYTAEARVEFDDGSSWEIELYAVQRVGGEFGLGVRPTLNAWFANGTKMPVNVLELTIRGDASDSMVNLAAYAHYLGLPQFNVQFVGEASTDLSKAEAVQLINSGCIRKIDLVEVDGELIAIVDPGDSCD